MGGFSKNLLGAIRMKSTLLPRLLQLRFHSLCFPFSLSISFYHLALENSIPYNNVISVEHNSKISWMAVYNDRETIIKFARFKNFHVGSLFSNFFDTQNSKNFCWFFSPKCCIYCRAGCVKRICGKLGDSVEYFDEIKCKLFISFYILHKNNVMWLL